jgi:NodT family efflux transporter outer membrane factor (OMF) lipoprotein
MITTISSCKVSKDIETPKDAIPENYRNSVSTDSVTIADIKWENFFTEPDLLKLINTAIVRNNDLQVATKNIQIASLQLKQAKWGNVPQADLFVAANTHRPSENSLSGSSTSQILGKSHIEDFTVGVGLSWEADIWGKIRNQKESALAQYMQSEEAKKALQTTIVANVSTGFYDLLMLDAQLEIAQKNLALNDNTLSIVNLQFESGQVTSLAKQQAEAQKLVAAKLIPQLEQNILIQENALSVITGEFPDSKERKSKLSTVVKENLSVGIPANLVSKRPDVKSAELALKIANSSVGITKANLYPSLSITAAGGLNSFKASNWFNIPASLFGTVAGGLTQPLLNGKRLKTQYEIAKVEREKSVLQFRQTVLIAVSEVSDAMVKIDKLEEQFSFASKRVETLQNAISNANLLFQNGKANYLEVITAQSNLLQSELELALIKRDRFVANVELYRSLGGGWK